MIAISANLFNNPEFDTLIMSNGVIWEGASLIAGRNAGTILRASFRRHFLLDSESILNLLSVYRESTPRLKRLKTHIKVYGANTYRAIHGLKIRVSAVHGKLQEFVKKFVNLQWILSC